MGVKIMWKFKTPGIPDEEFERVDDVPITKEEVRVIQISKARLKPGYTVYDIGCGSGSISVEAAFQIESAGKVYAVDFEPKAIELTKKNLEKFSFLIDSSTENRVSIKMVPITIRPPDFILLLHNSKISLVSPPVPPIKTASA